MPTITISKKELLKNINKKLTIGELKDRISFLGTDLESIEGHDINIEIFPNRPDLLSQQGFTRAFKSFIGEETGLKKYPVKKNNKNQLIVEEAVKEIRPYTACAIIRNLKLSDQKIKEIIQIQEKLHITYGRNRKKCAIGIYPLEKIKLPIKYTAKKPEEIRFQPLEAEKEMTGKEILQKHPTGREYAHLLEGKNKYPLFIDSNNQVLSMPPIINSELTGRVTTKTKEVFIECSGFSWQVVSKALAMITTALADMGGTIEEMTIKYPESMGGTRTSPDLEPETMKFKREYINKYLGYDLSEKEIKTLLARMGLGCEVREKEMEALIPAYRTDILHPIDLVEDIAIAYGMENIESTRIRADTIAEENPLEKFAEKIREILIGHELIEIKNYNLTNKESQTTMIKKEEEPIMVESSASKEYNTLRKHLIPSGLQTLKNNKHHEYPQNIFEIGEVFYEDEKTETGIGEKKKLSIILCGENNDYTRIRQILDSMGEATGIKIKVKPGEDSIFIKGRTGKIIIGEKEAGLIGEIHPEILENFEIEMPTAALELDLELMYEEIKKINEEIKI